MHFKSLAVLVSLVLAPFSRAEPCSSIETVAWMAGKWRAESQQTYIIEEWAEPNPSGMSGKGTSFDRATQQVKSRESLAVIAMDDELYYLAKPEHHPMLVPFKLTECDAAQAIFTNSEHDFPKSIEYRLNAKGELEVDVGAGQQQAFQHIYSRIVD